MVDSPTTDQIREKIQELLKAANLDDVTPKSVRRDLQSHFGKDLTDRKKEIAQIISDIVNADDSSSSSDEEIVDRYEDAKPNNHNSKNDKSRTTADSSESDIEDDEEVARRLQEEEANESRRSTRSGGKVSTKKVKKSPKKKERKGSSTNKRGGYMKPLRLSPELAEFTGEMEMPRHAVVKKIWDYCKEHNLMDKKDARFANCDAALLKVIGKKKFRMFGMMKLLAKHFEKD